MDKTTKEVFTINSYVAFFDGAAINNPGPAGIGCVITKDGEIIWKHSKAIGKATNNEAEYRALIALGKQLVEKNINTVVINGDSQLVVNQVNGCWRINHQHLSVLCNEARNTLSKINNWQLRWISRDKNTIADNLSKKALQETGDQPSVFTGKIEKVKENIYLAHGSNVYAVDLINQACTCPAFVNKNQRPCKHLVAVAQVQEKSNLNKNEEGLNGGQAIFETIKHSVPTI